MLGYSTISEGPISQGYITSGGTAPFPTGTITSQPAPDGQSQRFVGTTTNATSGSYILDGAAGDVGPTVFLVTNNAFDFTIAGIPSDTYTPLLTVSGPGGNTPVAGTSAFTIIPVTGGGGIEDTEPPALSGSVSITNITATGFTATWPVATDNIGVAGYEVSTDTGTASYAQVGNVLTINVTGKTASTTYTFRVQAYDAAGLRSGTLTAPVTTLSSLDNTNPAIPGTLTISNTTSDGCTVAWQAGTDNIGVTGYEFSADTGTPSYVSVGLVLTRVITGLASNTAHTIRVRAFDAAGNRSTALTAPVTTLAAIDSTVPVWAGGSVITASLITSNSFTLAWPVASDNVGVAGYELDNGSGTYVNVGNVLTSNVVGKAPATAFITRVRAYDSAGNRSLPLTRTVTTAAAPITTNNVVTFARISEAPTVQQLTALSSTPVGLVYKANSKQDLVLYNKSGSVVTVTLRGSGATTATTKGLAGVALDLSGGLPIIVPANSFVTLMLDNAVLFLKSDVTLIASANNAVFAGVIQ